jgi:tetratricopeptide (TPR) repeat protein
MEPPVNAMKSASFLAALALLNASPAAARHAGSPEGGLYMNMLRDSTASSRSDSRDSDLESLLRDIDESFRQGSYEKALRDIEKGLGMDPDHPDLLLKAATIHLMQGNEVNAKHHLDRLLTLRPDAPEILTASGMLAMRQGSAERAARLLEKAWSAEPRLSTQLQLLVLERVRLGYRAPDSVRSRPFGVEQWIVLAGWLRAEWNRYEDLLGAPDAALLVESIFGPGVRPGNLRDLQSLLQTHFALTREGNWRRARAVLDQVKALGLRGFGVDLQEAVLQFELGRPELAVDALRQLAADHPDYAPAWYNLGLAHLRREQYDEALSCFQEHLALEPDAAAARFAAAASHMALGRRDAAWALLKRMEAAQREPLREWLQGTDAYLSAIHRDPDYPAFARRLGLPR